MTTQYKTHGLVFKQEDGLEADRTFSIFTYDFGRLEVSGKAIRKITSKLKGSIEVFSFSEVEFVQGKTKKILTDALFLEKCKNIPRSPEKMAVARNIAKVLDIFLKGEQKDEKTWGLLADVFEKLNSDSLRIKHCPLLYYYFVGNFILALGHGPEISHCAVCSRALQPESLYFSNEEGGVVCATCTNVHKCSTRISPDVVKILRLIMEKDWQVLSRLKMGSSLQTSLEILESYLQYLLSAHSFKN